MHQHIQSNKAFRRWNVTVILMALFSAAAVVAMNVIIDPYQVFRVTAMKDGYTPNEWFNKLNHLLEDPGQYNAFMLGSSRLGLIDPQVLESVYPMSSFYNLSKFAARPSDWPDLLKGLEQSGVKMERVVIGLDLYPFISRRGGGDPAHIDPPALSGDNLLSFYSSYLFRSSFYVAAMKLGHHLSSDQDIAFNYATGVYSLPEYEKSYQENPEYYVETTFKKRPAPLTGATFIKSEFEALKAVKDWLASRNIEAVFFLHPHHPYLRAQVGDGFFSQFQDRLETILGQYTDCSSCLDQFGHHAFYDLKHYRPAFAQEVVASFSPQPHRASASLAAIQTQQQK